MKIRIKGNSIRIRLTRTEVEFFGKEKYLEEAVDFGNSKLTYALSSMSEVNELNAIFENNKITLNIPLKIAEEWANSERVGIASETALSEGKKLYILIEKDFKCLDNTIEDQSDNYPNPLMEKKS